MRQPDLAAAKQYVRERLETGLSPDLVYHNPRHTFDDVMPSAVRLGRLAGLDEESMLLLETAALFHDTGFLERYHGHESISIIIARNALSGFGYCDIQIQRICGLIAATRMPQRPLCHLQQLLCDADLDLLGREDFWELNTLLFEETLCFNPQPLTEVQWCESQIKFITDHKFFSPEARALRGPGQPRNLVMMRRELVRARLAENDHAAVFTGGVPASVSI